ncbi:deoxyribodipyrimidine photo-lyase [Pedobacter sp. SYSU D00535]|uniref:cryptochrome/photolyase family protein n=1 Tax=Pedobacter sp. SYSU D00535 TaxID=2810308 RepID=UPI001A977A8A|nr:deoxyribodipyrimidine photo-lyase [Pedobacter sp. SYSU D00535]
MKEKPEVNIFWFRRDLRLDDNCGLYHALKAGLPVLALFIFDRNILEQLEDEDDARVSFIHDAIVKLKAELAAKGSGLRVIHARPLEAFQQLQGEYTLRNVFINDDYEPYARKRDQEIGDYLKTKGINFKGYKDHVVFEKNEVLKEDGTPYTVFTPYKRKWLQKLEAEFHLKSYPSKEYLPNLYQCRQPEIPELAEIGFKRSPITVQIPEYIEVLGNYKNTRDYPALNGTSKLSVHLRFGTISIREAARLGLEHSPDTWLSELVWRDFYAMILWYFPHTVHSSFKKEFDNIRWRNNEAEFQFWCEGKTGYPIVDAGMRQLNATGWMHNRVRMVVASFLCKHLLIDWRWGEAYFARKLLDYDQASNIGGWQWAAGTGNDAAPYFRVFSPDLQTQKFDKKLEYIRKWIPEFDDPFRYPQPIVEHKFARERALEVYKAGLAK